MSDANEADTATEVDLSHLATEKFVPRCIVDVSEDSESSSSSSEDDSSSEVGSVKSWVSENVENLPKLKTVGELTLEDLPPIANLEISVPEEQCQVIGHIFNTVETLVLVKAVPDLPPVDIESVLFLDKGDCVLGQVFDVIGPVTEPIYCIRFNSKEYINELSFNPGDPVYYAPTLSYTNYVFLPDLLKMKGSDASWENGNEPPPSHLDYSDDEQERLAKRKLKGKRKLGGKANDRSQKPGRSPQNEVSLDQLPNDEDSEKIVPPDNGLNESRDRKKSPRAGQRSRKSAAKSPADFENESPQHESQNQSQVSRNTPHSRKNFDFRQNNESNFNLKRNQHESSQKMSSNSPRSGSCAPRNQFDSCEPQFPTNPGNFSGDSANFPSPCQSERNPFRFDRPPPSSNPFSTGNGPDRSMNCLPSPQNNNFTPRNPFSLPQPPFSNQMNPVNFPGNPTHFPPPLNSCQSPNPMNNPQRLPSNSENAPSSLLNPSLLTERPPPPFFGPPPVSGPPAHPPCLRPDLSVPPPNFSMAPSNVPSFGKPPPFPPGPFAQPAPSMLGIGTFSNPNEQSSGFNNQRP